MYANVLGEYIGPDCHTLPGVSSSDGLSVHGPDGRSDVAVRDASSFDGHACGSNSPDGPSHVH